ncbi:MAG: DNA-3-methyladenine glycosylase 2 family protein [Clostridia bacterium]|nr:DNA-3-methyladenine glycosylase 2 family protein [Clostridia bacterium]
MKNNFYKTEKMDGGVLITADFDFSLADTLECGQCFRFFKTDSGYEGVTRGKRLVLEQRENALFIGGIDINEADFWAEYFGLDINYREFHSRIVKNDILKQSASAAKGIRILKQDFFETLLSFIFSQNNNIPRIKKIVENFCRLFGEEIENGVFAFPTPDRLKDVKIEDLAPLKCGFRDKYIISAATAVIDGRVTEERINALDFEDAKALLMTIKGVGEKVADCVLLFGCNRLEAFPKDVWIKRVMAEIMPNGLPAELQDIAGIAQQYLFHYARNLKTE